MFAGIHPGGKPPVGSSCRQCCEIRGKSHGYKGLTDAQQEKVKSLFEEALGEADKSKLQMKALSPNSHPVMITRPEFMRRMQEMQAMQGMDMSAMGDFYNVVINTNHPLVAEKLVNMRSAEKKEKFASYLYNLARLNQHMLKGEELSEFIEESIEFLK